MATASAPSPAAPSSPPPGRGGNGVPLRAGRSGAGRIGAVAALAIVVLAAAYIVFAGGGGATYHLEFPEAFQLVRGDQVQVGGVPVGSITDIELTKDFKALVTIHVDSSLTPLHEGTTAQVRVPSLSSVANRYIALEPGPNNRASLGEGATLPASATKEVTDLDQLFNTLNPQTRNGLKQFIQGSAEQYAGASRSFGESTEYFAPFLGATSHFLGELSRDQAVFSNFLVETAKTVTTLSSRAEPLSELIGHGNQTFAAVAARQTQLAEGFKQLPATLRQGNRTFAELPSTLAALKALVDASKPVNPSLTLLLERPRPLVTTATEPVHDLALSFSRPGPNNDFTDLVRVIPQLYRELTSASPSSVKSLQESVPITAFFGPYAPDLAGTLRTFGQAAASYDANGHFAELSPVLPDFVLGENDTLKPGSPEQDLAALRTGQLRRCPGSATQPAADGSSPFTDGEALTCDPSETP